MKFYDIVQKCILSDVSMALYRLPKDDRTFLIIDTEKANTLGFASLVSKYEGFVFHSYQKSDRNPVWFINPSFVITSDDKEYSDEFLAFVRNLSESPRENRVCNIDIKELDYKKDVNDLINHINKEKLKKVVYSRTKTVNDKGIKDALDVFVNLDKEYDDAFVFFVNITNELSWIGASPELLLSMDEDEMHTMALAGTQKCVGEDICDVVWESKDKKEQEYVCDYIDSKLYGLDFIKEDTHTVKAGNVCHLQTKYKIQADDDEYWHIIKSLHPTPAVCGLPAKEAIKAISSFEKHDRAYYSGFLGPLNIFSTTAMYVNLRSARVLQNKMQLFVGGGITADSSACKEWEETEIKSQTIINIL